MDGKFWMCSRWGLVVLMLLFNLINVGFMFNGRFVLIGWMLNFCCLNVGFWLGGFWLYGRWTYVV